MLDVNDVSVELGGRRRLSKARFQLHPGEFLAVIGPNGAGKSTLLRAISGDTPISAGSIRIAGRDRADWERRSLSRHMAVMEQSQDVAFDFSVRELVELGRGPYRGLASRRHDAEIVERAMATAGLTEFSERSVLTLSGGERQRTFFAKAIAQLCSVPDMLHGAGRLLLLDEPTSALDLSQQARIMYATRSVARAGGAVLAVLHDLNLAAAFADRILVLVDGDIVASGPPNEILVQSRLETWFDCHIRIDRPASGERVVISVEPD